MMKHNRGEAGFTLVELMVAILCGTIVTAAAITIMLLGLRINRSAVDTASDQYDARVVLSVLEDLATEGTIKRVEQLGSDWAIYDSSDESASPKFTYKSEDGKIYSGSSVLIDGISASSVSLSKNGLLSFSITTKRSTYDSSVYCRFADIDDDNEISGSVGNNSGDNIFVPDDNITITPSDKDVAAARREFLEILLSQYDSDGRIKHSGEHTDKYFSEWYAEKKLGHTNGWGKGTAWCACFVSWAAHQVGTYLVTEPLFAYVQDGLNGFYAGGNLSGGEYGQWVNRGDGYVPTPGDLIFFQFDNDAESDHVGVVYYVDSSYVYTIEGNSGNRVAIRKYPLTSDYIFGYGVLKWSTGANAQ